MATATFTKTGTKATAAVKLTPEIFNAKTAKHEPIKLAYDAYLANGRINLATTKTRGLVSGGGRKPWQQKGTGRARVGSSRTPIWRGGGIIFGPTGKENFTKQVNKKARRSALISALTLASRAGKIVVIEDIEAKTIKTATLAKLLEKMNLSGYCLIVVDQISLNLKKSAANLANVKLIQAKYLNTARVLDADTILIAKPALTVIDNWLKEAV